MTQKCKQHKPSPIMEDEQSKISDGVQLDDELQTADDDTEEDGEEDVLAMAMAEKANALLRGKSEDYDRTFVPSVINQMTPSPDVSVIPEQTDGERSSTSTTVKLPRPGAFSLSRRNASEGDVALAESMSTGEEESVENEKIILIPHASLVVSDDTSATELDLECSVNAQESPQIAEVVKMPSSDMDQNVDSAALRKDRRRKFFRWLILLTLLMIAAALVALVVEMKKPDNRIEEFGEKTHSSVDGDDIAEYDDESNGDHGEMYRNNTRRRRMVDEE